MPEQHPADFGFESSQKIANPKPAAVATASPAVPKVTTLNSRNGHFAVKILSCTRKLIPMTNLLLSAFYDNVNKNVGPTLMWVFFLLMIIELIYVMVKYLGSSNEK